MNLLTLALTGSMLAATLATAPGAEDDAPALDAYELAAEAAVPLLSPALQPVLGLAPRFNTLNLTARGRLAIVVGDHCLMLDVAATDASRQSRMAAAERFPRDLASARILCSKRGVEGGQLPWEIEEQVARLAEAMRASGSESLVREARVLIVLATAASLPFNTTVDRQGRRWGNVSWSMAGTSTEARRHRTVRHRYHVEVIRRLRSRLAFEVRISPERMMTVNDPISATFDVLLGAYRSVDELAMLDVEVTTELRITGALSFLSRADQYYARVAQRAAPILEARIEAGALLGAELITTAWTRAGRPSFAHLAAPTPPSTIESKATRVARRFVGSRHSKVYHRATCPHAARIKKSNLVHFDSLRRVREAGRRACKACTPDK